MSRIKGMSQDHYNDYKTAKELCYSDEVLDQIKYEKDSIKRKIILTNARKSLK